MHVFEHLQSRGASRFLQIFKDLWLIIQHISAEIFNKSFNLDLVSRKTIFLRLARSSFNFGFLNSHVLKLRQNGFRTFGHLYQ